METLEVKINNEVRKVILPQIGMVGTMFVGSDRYVVCCNTVLSNKKCGLVVVHEISEKNIHKYIKKDNESVEFLTDNAFNELVPGNDTIYYSLRKNGVWYPVGNKIAPGCSGVKFGFANPYMDPSF